MRLRILGLLMALILLLGGCAALSGGSYSSVTPHAQSYSQADQSISVEARDYAQLHELLVRQVAKQTEYIQLDVSGYDGNPEKELARAIAYAKSTDPLTAFAVLDFSWSMAEVGVRQVINIKIQYSKTREQIQGIEQAWGLAGVENRIGAALLSAQESLTLKFNSYEPIDLTAFVERFYKEHGDAVMELPTVTAELYPKHGNIRILDIKFSYTNPRQTLLSMTEEVKLMLSSAVSYVRGQKTDADKVERLSAFLAPMLTEQGSTPTPVYSMLYQGVGDEYSVARVFYLLCRETGLKCWEVMGQDENGPRYWNMVELDGVRCHLNLMECWNVGELLLRYDDEMTGLTWDTAAFPDCPHPTEPEQTETGPSEPGQTETTPTEPGEQPTEPGETLP